MRKIMPLSDAEEYAYENSDDICLDNPIRPDDWAEGEEGGVWLDGWYAYVPLLKLRLYPGVYICDGDAEFSLTAISDEKGAMLYYEQDGFITTLHNFIRSTTDDELSWDELSALKCEIETK